MQTAFCTRIMSARIARTDVTIRKSIELTLDHPWRVRIALATAPCYSLQKLKMAWSSPDHPEEHWPIAADVVLLPGKTASKCWGSGFCPGHGEWSHIKRACSDLENSFGLHAVGKRDLHKRSIFPYRNDINVGSASKLTGRLLARICLMTLPGS